MYYFQDYFWNVKRSNVCSLLPSTVSLPFFCFRVSSNLPLFDKPTRGDFRSPCRMATRLTPSFVQNENIHVPRAKGTDGALVGGSVAPLKPSEKKKKGGRTDRKALADVSHAPARFAVPFPSKGTVAKNLKDRAKPVLNAAAASTTVKQQALKNEARRRSSYGFLSEEDIKKCQEWAEEGIEYAPVNDFENLAKDAHDKRVEEEVDMVMSCMKNWLDTSFNEFVGPPRNREDSKDTWDMPKFKLEPEITLLRTSRSVFLSGTEDVDGLLETEVPLFHSFKDDDFVFELKESRDVSL